LDYNTMLKKMKDGAVPFKLDADDETINESWIDSGYIYAKMQKKLDIPVNRTQDAIEAANELNRVLFRGAAYIDEDWGKIVFVVPVRGTDVKSLKYAIDICGATATMDTFRGLCHEFEPGE